MVASNFSRRLMVRQLVLPTGECRMNEIIELLGGVVVRHYPFGGRELPQCEWLSGTFLLAGGRLLPR